MKKLQIAVGIIRNQHNEIFITQRAADAHMANKLEFPGGKIEAGETPEQALIRELQEEVGITPTQNSLFEKLEYQFPDRHITLWFWLVESCLHLFQLKIPMQNRLACLCQVFRQILQYWLSPSLSMKHTRREEV